MPRPYNLGLCAAQMIFYPTAIGTEPQDDKLDSYLHWARVMMGHSGANLVRPCGWSCATHIQQFSYAFLHMQNSQCAAELG